MLELLNFEVIKVFVQKMLSVFKRDEFLLEIRQGYQH
jgi:hypothetical protein